MAYTKTTWVNDQAPPINASNLNKMEQGIYDAQYPDNGTTGQYLKKGSSGPEWSDVDALPSGGTTGQVLKKTADGAEWADETGTVESVNNIEPDGNKNVQTQVTLTQAQYDALELAGTVDPKVMYLITDGTVSYPTASTMAYDNDTSGLTAENVQDAIDEVAGRFRGAQYSRSESIESASSITPTKDGWLTVIFKTDSGVSIMPVGAISQGGTDVSSAIGLTNSGTTFTCSCPVKAGVTYTLSYYRCTIHGIRLYY